MKNVLLLLFAFQVGTASAQSTYSPSKKLSMIQINGYRYPAPSFYNLLWLALMPESSFIKEVELFDFRSMDIHENYCVYFSSENQVPSGHYYVQKCQDGEVNIYWEMDAGRIDRMSIGEILKRDMAAYSSIQENNQTVYKIWYSKWYLVIQIAGTAEQEVISVRSYREPQ